MGMVLYQVDAFTNQPFHGNPAAVCLLDGPGDKIWMQNVAREMNLSETAFLYPVKGGFNLRWFTPEVEVDLCGHATLASAYALWQGGYLGREEEACFFSASGLLRARLSGDWIQLDFPIRQQRAAEVPSAVLQAIEISQERVNYVGRYQKDYLIEVDSEELLRQTQPDFKRLREAATGGIMLTAQSEDVTYDFISRYFDPAEGIDEDPVTGSAHCCLGPYWGAKLGKQQLSAFQASARGGSLTIRLGEERVYIQGQAVMVLRGELLS